MNFMSILVAEYGIANHEILWNYSYSTSGLVHKPTRLPQPASIDKKCSSTTSDQLSSFLSDAKLTGGHWPESAQAEAVNLFGTADINVKMSQELALIYCIYADFDPLPRHASKFVSADEGHEKALEYVKDHAHHLRILQTIFPMTDNHETEMTEEKLDCYGDYCWKLQEPLVKRGETDLYNHAIKASAALVTLHAALSKLQNSSNSI